MAHDCPECGGLCYCDLEDAMSSIAPEDCAHECADEPEEDEPFFEDDESVIVISPDDFK